MRITPSNTFHLQQAYNLPATTPTKPVATPVQSRQVTSRTATSTDAIALQSGATPKHTPAMRRIIAAPVPGGVDFSGDSPVPSSPALPLYNHPADRNAAATSLLSGRMIDTQG